MSGDEGAKVRILPRPHDGSNPKGILRIPGNAAAHGAVNTRHRFWENGRQDASGWTDKQKAHFTNVAVHIRKKSPQWMQDLKDQTEAELLLRECLEICAVSQEASPEVCLRKWLFACGMDYLYINNEETGALECKTRMVSDATSELRELRRKIDALHAKSSMHHNEASHPQVSLSPRKTAASDSNVKAAADTPLPTTTTAAQEGEASLGHSPDDSGNEDETPGTKPPEEKQLDRVINPTHYPHFTCPKEVHVMPIPDIFDTVGDWVKVVSSNILAEYWALVHAFEGPRGYKHWLVADCEIKTNNTATTCALPIETPGELSHQLFRFSDDCDAMFRIITKITKAGGGAAESDLATTDAPANSNTFNFMFYPPLGNCTATMARKKKKAQFIAYIGTHLLEYSSIQEFKNLEFNAAEQSFVGLTSSSQLLQSVLDPRRRFQGLWRRPESDAPRKDRDAKRRAAESSPLPILDGFLPPRGLVLGQLEPLNSSQNSVIDGLHGVLEVIHGPPGTGKSTTISYLIQERLSETDKILVTCTRNGAVDSLAAKLQGRIPMLVVGSKGTVGEVANEWRLPEQLRRHPGLQRCTETLNLIETFVDGISKAFERHEKALKSRGRYLLLRYTMPRHSARKKLVLTMYEFAKEKLLDAQARVGTLRRSLAQLVWKNTRVFVCTVAASVRLYTDYVQCHNDSNFTVDTVVVDECGCTSETATAVLLKLKPRQLLLLGDHKQLPAFSLINGSDTNHAQSLMERLVKVSPSEKVMLTEQYRMHPHICKLVSHLFYDKRLLTAAKRKKAGLAKKANGLQPLTWVDHTTKEEKPEGQSFSFVNHGEVEMVKQIILSLTRNKKVNKDISIAAMAFYRAQCALMTEELKGLNVEVATVDSVQGREFDVVILSCVRSNKDRDIGFLRDLPRMCVSLSRAREALYIVGDAKTLTCNPNWKMVHNYITAPNKDKYQLDAAIGDTSVVREGGIVPDHIVPRSRPQAQSNAGNASSTNADGSAARKDDDDFFVYYDPVAARRGVLIPAAWHQKEALRQAGSGGVGPQGPMPYNPKQLANGRNLYNAQNSHGGGHGHQGGAGGGGDAKGGGGQTGAGAGSQGPVPPPQQQQQSQQTWTDVWPSLQPTFTITVGGKPTPPAAPAAGSSTSSAQPAPAQPLASAAAAALSHASPAAQAAPALPANGTAAVTIPFAAAGARGPPQHHAHHHSQKPKPKRGPIHGGINIPATFAAPAAQKPVDLTFPAFAQFPDASLAGFSAFNGLQQTGAISQTPVWNPLTSSYVPQSCYATEYSAALGLTTQLPNSAYHPLPSQNAGQYWYGNQYY